MKRFVSFRCHKIRLLSSSTFFSVCFLFCQVCLKIYYSPKSFDKSVKEIANLRKFLMLRTYSGLSEFNIVEIRPFSILTSLFLRIKQKIKIRFTMNRHLFNLFYGPKLTKVLNSFLRCFLF